MKRSLTFKLRINEEERGFYSAGSKKASIDLEGMLSGIYSLMQPKSFKSFPQNWLEN